MEKEMKTLKYNVGFINFNLFKKTRRGTVHSIRSFNNSPHSQRFKAKKLAEGCAINTDTNEVR